MSRNSSRPSSRSVDSDTVRWSDEVSAPLIIPIICLIVVASAVICSILKYLKIVWDKKRRSKTYEIRDTSPEDSMIPPDFASSVDQTDQMPPEKASLSLLRFSGVKKKVEKKRKNMVVRIETPDSDPETTESNGRLRIEANVHDSSNEANDCILEDLEEFPPNHRENVEHVTSRNAPLATTESEV